ncbi:alpha-L-rhamnosidase-related protein [Priestia megaterium]|uniref:alpha-L-rhamnosidase-related protein n=1 Tax=Priestia megaterium TaxID=1404 RepID=UPI0027E2A984|nr:sugar hydrolase [Priestia megaterium]
MPWRKIILTNNVKIQKIENQAVKRIEPFIIQAENLKPKLIKDVIAPYHFVEVVADAEAMHGWRTKPIGPAAEIVIHNYGKGDQFILDFGDHQVGYVKMDIRPIGSPPDAPLHLKLTFGEMPVEMAEPFESYDGWISSSWLQEESIYVDVLPGRIELPRRYSFRYIKFEVVDTSLKYRVAFDNIQCHTVTSGNKELVKPLNHSDPILNQIDKVSIKTLQDCMQDVFEDGPKRDRRLWLGDLRLQALANYETFQNNDLVKRCLYLFAGVPNNKGEVAANLFIKPSLIPDDTYLFDYSLLFVTTLHDYYFKVKDHETLVELWPIAYRQIEIALERLDERNILKDSDDWWSFIDWHEKLNKQGPSQAVLIYTIKRAIKLAEILSSDKLSFLEKRLQDIVEATFIHLWRKDKGFFVSGSENQISWATQIWMVLAEVLDPGENNQLMHRLLLEQPEIGLTTPYMYHYLVEALILVGEKDKAVNQLKAYWGEMLKDGADTFWELYDPNNKEFSPYGSQLINSYCHAWSCTPTYLIRYYNL